MKKLKLVKILACSLALTSAFFLNKTNVFSVNEQSKKIENQQAPQKNSAKPYSDEEIKKMVEDSWNSEIKEKTENSKIIIIIGEGGGYGLEDPYHLNGKQENRKMNDLVYLLGNLVTKYLDEDITVLFVNGVDKTIDLPKDIKTDEFVKILPDIEQNAQGGYDKYYSGNNQRLATRLISEKIAEAKSAYICCKELFDEKLDEPVIDEKTNEPVLIATKIQFAPKTIAHVSLQTNANDLHNGEGISLYYHPSDIEGKELSETIANYSKNSFTNKHIKTENRNLIFPTTKKIITKNGEFGLPTTIDFVDYTDNRKTQFKFFDEDALERASMHLGKAICEHFNIDITYADLDFKPVFDNENCLKYIKINISIRGYDVDKIQNCSIAILNAANEKELSQPQNFKRKLKISRSDIDKKITAEFKFVPPQNCDLRREINDSFYIKIYRDDKYDNSNNIIPANVTNFKIKKDYSNDKEPVKVEPNAVYKKNVDEMKKDFPNLFQKN